jgi:hypothetical protein
MFKQRFADEVEAGNISDEDAKSFKKFIDLSNEPTFNLIIYTKLGQLTHLEHDPGY